MSRRLQAAWGAKWKTGTPFTIVIGTDGKVLYQKEGKIDILDVRRTILAHMPDTKSYIGQQAYWQAAVADKTEVADYSLVVLSEV